MKPPQPINHLLPVEPDRPDEDADEIEARRNQKRSQEIKVAEANRIAGLKHLMAHRDGRAWMWSLLEQCGPLRNAFTGNSSTFFQCGQQYIGQHIIADLKKHCNASFRQMEDESEAMTRG